MTRSARCSTTSPRLDGLRTGLVDPDDVPPVPDEPYVRAGDQYALGEHRLLCSDATNAVDVARLLDGAKPTLLATDPPYGVSLDPTWRDGVYNALGPAEPGYLRVYATPDRRLRMARRGACRGGRRRPRADRLRDRQPGDLGQGLFAIGRSWYHWGHEPCWVVRRAGSKTRFLATRDQSIIWRAMTAARRLDKVEAALTPTQRVLAWLDEAHTWGTLSTYVDSLLDKWPDDFPINRLAADAATATRAALRGKPPETVAAAVRKAVLATVFRFHLALRINVVAHEIIDERRSSTWRWPDSSRSSVGTIGRSD